jgi:transcriptional regulator with XRE-family HTH domain
MNWQKKQTYVLEHYLRVSVLWDLTFERAVSNRHIAEHLGTSVSTVQSTLTGKSVLFTVNREAAILAAINRATEGVHTPLALEDLIMRRHKLLEQIRRGHGEVEVIGEQPGGESFPRHPPKTTERLLRAYQVQDFLSMCRSVRMRGQVTESMELGFWAEVFHPENIEPDQIWRWMRKKGWTYQDLADAFGMRSAGTPYHWVRVNFPQRHWKTARAIFPRRWR